MANSQAEKARRLESTPISRRANRDFLRRWCFRRARASPSLSAPPRPTTVAMSLAEGQKALQTFNEWCDTQGIEYDREVRRVSRVFRDATHRRSRDGFSSAVPGVVPAESAHLPRLPPPHRPRALRRLRFARSWTAPPRTRTGTTTPCSRGETSRMATWWFGPSKRACLSARASSCARSSGRSGSAGASR